MNPNVKLIHHTGVFDQPDVPHEGFPARLEVRLRAPEFLQVAYTLAHGQERVILIGRDRAALEAFLHANHLRAHPRLVSITITP